MIATRHPCALTGIALSLLLGLAPIASAQPRKAQPNPNNGNNNTAATEKAMQQMTALFPYMNNPYAFAHLQNAYNQMLMTMPNDPWGNANARMNNNTPYQNTGTPYQNNLFGNQPGYGFGNQPGNGQNSLFGNQPGIARNQGNMNRNANNNNFGMQPGTFGQGTYNSNYQQSAMLQQQQAMQQQQSMLQRQHQGGGGCQPQQHHVEHHHHR